MTGVSAAPLDPENLHPALWRAQQWARARSAVSSTGFAALDAQLPGGGWPHQALTECLLPHPGVGEMRLLAPVMAALTQQGRTVMWVGPPASPCAWGLQQLGVDVQAVVVVRGRDEARDEVRHVKRRPLLASADVLWALEQALRSGHVGAVVAWLPDTLRAETMRRLQLAAQAHEGWAVIIRSMAVRSKPSPVPLRMIMRPAGADSVWVQVIKRRGPTHAQPVQLNLPPVVPALAARAAATLESAGAQPDQPRTPLAA